MPIQTGYKAVILPIAAIGKKIFLLKLLKYIKVLSYKKVCKHINIKSSKYIKISNSFKIPFFQRCFEGSSAEIRISVLFPSQLPSPCFGNFTCQRSETQFGTKYEIRQISNLNKSPFVPFGFLKLPSASLLGSKSNRSVRFCLSFFVYIVSHLAAPGRAPTTTSLGANRPSAPHLT